MKFVMILISCIACALLFAAFVAGSFYFQSLPEVEGMMANPLLDELQLLYDLISVFKRFSRAVCLMSVAASVCLFSCVMCLVRLGKNGEDS